MFMLHFGPHSSWGFHKRFLFLFTIDFYKELEMKDIMVSNTSSISALRSAYHDMGDLGAASSAMLQLMQSRNVETLPIVSTLVTTCS